MNKARAGKGRGRAVRDVIVDRFALHQLSAVLAVHLVLGALVRGLVLAQHGGGAKSAELIFVPASLEMLVETNEVLSSQERLFRAIGVLAAHHLAPNVLGDGGSGRKLNRGRCSAARTRIVSSLVHIAPTEATVRGRAFHAALGLFEDALAETADLAIAGERRDEPLGVDLLGVSCLGHGWFRKLA